MNQFIPVNSSTTLPALIVAASDDTGIWFLEFFATRIRNPHTRWTYSRAVVDFVVYSFARINAALGVKVEDVFTQNRRLWVRLREKGDKPHTMPCHHNLAAYLHACMGAASLAADPTRPLFRMIGRSKGRPLTRAPMQQAKAYLMIERWRLAAGIQTKLGNHKLPRDRDNRLPEKCGHVGEGGSDGQPRQHPHNLTLRLAA
jgi:integrase